MSVSSVPNLAGNLGYDFSSAPGQLSTTPSFSGTSAGVGTVPQNNGIMGDGSSTLPSSMYGTGGGVGTPDTSWYQPGNGSGFNFNDFMSGGGSQLLGGLGTLFGATSGNQNNQAIASDLKGMYNNAQAQAQPSINATNNMITNPNSFFQSPLYQAQASLYGNNVMAGKNASGTSGNNIDYSQKMMGFGANQYNQNLSTLGNISNNFMNNQRGYAQDYANGSMIGNSSSGGMLGGLMSGAGGIASGLSSLGVF